MVCHLWECPHSATECLLYLFVLCDILLLSALISIPGPFRCSALLQIPGNYICHTPLPSGFWAGSASGMLWRRTWREEVVRSHSISLRTETAPLWDSGSCWTVPWPTQPLPTRSPVLVVLIAGLNPGWRDKRRPTYSCPVFKSYPSNTDS